MSKNPANANDFLIQSKSGKYNVITVRELRLALIALSLLSFVFGSISGMAWLITSTPYLCKFL